MLTKKTITEALATWVALNATLVKASEADCEKLMAAETQGKARRQFLRRIHSRYNRMRALRERTAL